MRELALFAGAGGGILGGRLLGWRTVVAVERDAYAASILAQRQNDGFLEPFPIWSDVSTFDGRPWRGIVDVVSGGFPCQDISAAGKGAGIDGARSGLWSEMARIIGEVRPRFAFVENSPMLTVRGLGRVLGDLAAMGFDAEWGVLSAADVGAPHGRERIWIVAHAAQIPRGRDADRSGFDAVISNAMRDRLEKVESAWTATWPISGPEYGGNSNWWKSEPGLGRVADGVADRVDRLRAIGNGQVPQCAAEAFRRLSARFNENGEFA